MILQDDDPGPGGQAGPRKSAFWLLTRKLLLSSRHHRMPWYFENLDVLMATPKVVKILIFSRTILGEAFLIKADTPVRCLAFTIKADKM